MKLNEIVEDVDFFYTGKVETEPTVADVCEEITRLRAIAATVGVSPKFYACGDLEGNERGCIGMTPFKLGDTEYQLEEMWLDFEDMEFVAYKMGARVWWDD
jgi:hypothetical protein